jgi:hypothetical protein
MSVFQDPPVRVCAKTTSGQKTQFKHHEKKRVRQKNGGRKMKVSHFAQRRGAGRLIFLPRIFLTFGVREGDREIAS